MFKCSVPNCNHIAYTILNSHYIEKHGMSKKEAKQKYGLEEHLRSRVKSESGVDLTSWQAGDRVNSKLREKLRR